MRRLLTFALAGLGAQLIDGSLGMAYGVTATTVLLSAGTAPAVASATVHLAEVGTTFASGMAHWRLGNVSWRLVGLLGVPGAAGAFLGATVLSSFQASWMRPTTSGVLLALGVLVLARFAFGFRTGPVRRSFLRLRTLGPLGVGAGFLDAIGGGGWGPVTTPTLLTVARMEPRRTIGTVSAAEFLVSLAASLGFLFGLGRAGLDLGLAAALLAGGLVAAPVAAYAVKRLPAAVTGTLVGGVIITTNLRTILAHYGVDGPDRLLSLAAVAGVTAVLLVRASRRPAFVAA